jgi:transcriptional regulator GlxA family with amidase domain
MTTIVRIFTHMNVLLPVLDGAVSGSVLSILDIINHSRSFRDIVIPDRAGEPFFNASLVSAGEGLNQESFGFQIMCNYTLETAPQATVVIMPACVGDLPVILRNNKPLLDWMVRQHRDGAIICSTCTGAYFLAEAGLLDSRRATVSWFAADSFRKRYPHIEVVDEKILVDDGDVMTTGATMSYINLCLHLIEKFYGKESAQYASKVFVADKGRTSQLPYSVFSAYKDHRDKEILAAQGMLELEEGAPLGSAAILEKLNMSERTFIRRFKAATGNTPSEYAQRIKVERAKKLLEEGTLSIKEVTYKTGYEDLTFFRDIFKRYTGLTPGAYRKMFA